MAFVKKTRYLFAPPYCKSVETFISPILSSPFELLDGLKLAGGWRSFKNLRVLQKKKSFDRSSNVNSRIVETC